VLFKLKSRPSTAIKMGIEALDSGKIEKTKKKKPHKIFFFSISIPSVPFTRDV
jgi:hypothetical protein